MLGEEYMPNAMYVIESENSVFESYDNAIKDAIEKNKYKDSKNCVCIEKESVVCRRNKEKESEWNVL
jgi:hypothetical protein